MKRLGCVVVFFLLSGINSQAPCRSSSPWRPIFFVAIECTSQNLKINWKLDERRYLRDYVLHFTSTLFISCTNLSGKEIYNSSITEEQPEGMAGSLSLDIRNISSCIAYGCHSYYDQQRLTENSTCSVGGTLPIESSIQTVSVTSSISPEETSFPTIPISSDNYSTQIPLTPTQLLLISTQSKVLASVIPTITNPPPSPWIQPVSTRYPVSAKHPVSARCPSNTPLSQPLSNVPKSKQYNSGVFKNAIGILAFAVMAFILCTMAISILLICLREKKRLKIISQ